MKSNRHRGVRCVRLLSGLQFLEYISICLNALNASQCAFFSLWIYGKVSLQPKPQKTASDPALCNPDAQAWQNLAHGFSIRKELLQ